MGYDLSKEALMKSRKGVRPARVHTLVNKESAGTGWQSKYKSVKKQSSVSDSIEKAILLKAAGVDLTWYDSLSAIEKYAFMSTLKNVATTIGGAVKNKATSLGGAVKKFVKKPVVPSGVEDPSRAIANINLDAAPTVGRIGSKKGLQLAPTKAPATPKTTPSTSQQVPSPTAIQSTPGGGISSNTPYGPNIVTRSPQQVTPKELLQKSTPPPTPQPKQTASTQPPPAQQTAPQQTAPQQTASTPQQPAPQPKQPTQKTAPPAAPKEAPLPQGYLTPTPELQAAVKSQPGNLATIKQQMSSMPAGQQYEVLSSRSVQLNNMAKSTNPATAAAAKNELAEVNKALKSLSTGQPLTGATSEGWKTFKRYAIPTAIGGGLLYGGSQILNAGTQAYSGPYVPQGY